MILHIIIIIIIIIIIPSACHKLKYIIIAFNKNLGEMSERLDRASDRLQKKIKSQSSGVFRDKINLQKTIDRNFGGNFGKRKNYW